MITANQRWKQSGTDLSFKEWINMQPLNVAGDPVDVNVKSDVTILGMKPVVFITVTAITIIAAAAIITYVVKTQKNK